MRDVNVITVPAATDVDYSSIDEIYGYHMLMCKIFERAGGMDYPPVNNVTIRACQRQGLIWLREVKLLISDILDGKSTVPLAAIPDLASAYDMMHRICNGNPCFDYIRDVRFKTVGRWIHGDRSISQTDVALLLLTEIDRDIRGVDERYTDFALRILDSWIGELIEYGRFIDAPAPEVYSRLTYILKTDLFVFLGSKEREDAAKRAWTKEYAPEWQPAFNARTMLLYIGFLLTANQRGYYTPESEDALYDRLWSEYITRPDVNPYFRQALEIDFAKVNRTA